MGKPKFSLTYDGVSGTEKAVKLLSKFCNKVFLSSRADLDMGSLGHIANVERVNDDHTGLGPVGGLATLMGQFPDKAWMITACDMPFLKEEDFKAILQNRDPLKYGTCYVQKGSFGYEPMCAIYEPKFIVPLFEAMSRRELSLSRIIAGSASIEALPFKKLKINEVGPVKVYEHQHNGRLREEKLKISRVSKEGNIMSMIQVQEARDQILSKIKVKGVEKVSLGQALGRVLAEDVISGVNNPPLDNSAMDGYALIAEDIAAATPESPVKLEVVEEIAAGYSAKGTLKPGQAMRIMTGAPIPAGANAVLMQEDTDKDGNFIHANDRADVEENIRKAGEDVQKGETVIKKGVTLSPAHIGMMAVVGRSQVAVGQRPTVAILSTGDEILELDQKPEGPQIYNSNGHMLAAQIRSAGGIPVYLGIAKDIEEDLMEKFEWALKSDIVVSSGGVSVGDYDLVKASLQKMGQEMLFWKVAMKPGKPLAFGRIGDTPIFGLPGNPVSSFVSFEQFVRPSLKKVMGCSNLMHQTVQAKLTRTIHKKPGRLHFLSAIVSSNNGEYTVTPAGEQGSGILKSAANANGLLIFPLEEAEIKKGAQVAVQLLDI